MFRDLSSVEDAVLLDFVRECNQRTSSSMVFKPIHERDLVQYILKCVNYYYGLSVKELRELAYHFAKKLEVEYPPIWDDDENAGKHWYYNFMRCHPELVLRTPEQTSMQRVKGFCKSNVEKFFENYGHLMDDNHFEATIIYNMDESGFSTVLTKIGKVIAIKGIRHVAQLEAAERGTMVTMALTVS